MPDILIIELYDKKNVDLNLKSKLLGLNYLEPGGNKVNATHTMTFNSNKFGEIKYKLDSVVLRSNNKKHFGAFITGNSKEYRFDGHTRSHLQPFEWKKLLNKNKNFNFKNDETPNGNWKPLNYNFSNGVWLHNGPGHVFPTFFAHVFICVPFFVVFNLS